MSSVFAVFSVVESRIGAGVRQSSSIVRAAGADQGHTKSTKDAKLTKGGFA
jgi:hypothetical protein